jgi:hypothetical protein
MGNGGEWGTLLTCAIFVQCAANGITQIRLPLSSPPAFTTRVGKGAAGLRSLVRDTDSSAMWIGMDRQ